MACQKTIFENNFGRGLFLIEINFNTMGVFEKLPKSDSVLVHFLTNPNPSLPESTPLVPLPLPIIKPSTLKNPPKHQHVPYLQPPSPLLDPSLKAALFLSLFSLLEAQTPIKVPELLPLHSPLTLPAEGSDSPRGLLSPETAQQQHGERGEREE